VGDYHRFRRKGFERRLRAGFYQFLVTRWDSGWLYRVMLEDSEWVVNGGLGTGELSSVVPSSPPLALHQSFCIYILL